MKRMDWVLETGCWCLVVGIGAAAMGFPEAALWIFREGTLGVLLGILWAAGE